MVAPRSQGVGDSLAGDTLGSLQDVAVVAAELDAGADSADRDAKKTALVRGRNNNLCVLCFLALRAMPAKTLQFVLK